MQKNSVNSNSFWSIRIEKEADSNYNTAEHNGLFIFPGSRYKLADGKAGDNEKLYFKIISKSE